MTAQQMGLASCLLVLGLGVPAQAETFTVTTTEDSGPGSLREQITAANATPERDVIEFDVAGTIRLVSALPPITQPLAMDGEGATEIDGTDVEAGVFALDIQHTSGCVIEGMTIRNFHGQGSGAIRIQGDAFDNVVARNILAGNRRGGMIVEGPEDAGHNLVEGNYIDSEAGALAPVPGDWHPIDGVSTGGIGVFAASGNVISENWVFRCTAGIFIQGDNNSGYAPGESHGNEVTRNRIFFAGNQGLLVGIDASDNTLSGNEVYYAGREGIEVTGNRGVANRNVVTDNLIVGNGRNDPRYGAILIIASADDNVVSRNRIRGSHTPGLMVQENARGNVFQDNEVDGAEGPGILLVGGETDSPHLPGNGPVAENHFERNTFSNTLGSVRIQGNVVGNIFRDNVFGSQVGSAVVRVDGDPTPEAPDRVVADNRFEKNVHKDVDGLLRWSFTNATRNDTICGPDLPGRLALDAFGRLRTPEGLGNVVVPHCDDKD